MSRCILGLSMVLPVLFLVQSQVLAEEKAAAPAAAEESIHQPVPASAPVKEAKAEPSPEIKAPAMKAGTEKADFFNEYIAKRLELGTRITYFQLIEDERGGENNGSFFGSIYMLEEDQDYWPNKFYAQYMILPYLGLGVAYDHVRAKTKDGPADSNTDGDVDVSGPVFYLHGAYPNETQFTPFAELGWAWYSAKFEETSDWSMDGYRAVELDNTSGFSIGLGCDVTIYKNWSANVFYRYSAISDVDLTYLRGGVPTKLWGSTDSFAMKNNAAGIGVKYTF